MRLPWVRSVEVTLSAKKARSPGEARAPGLEKVANLVAVASCKGGVGKSTVAVNLAFALSRAGARVGLFDADVYGPSLPTMVRPEATQVFQEAGLIVPLEYEGVKLMSFGYIPQAGGGGAAIMRGPMVSNVINQLLTGTNWGELDYLVLDLPPGTGDIQLTLAQLVPLTAAVMVTTPQQLSFVDVVKGIQMFDKLKVPTVAVVENMCYFVCDGCGKRHDLFGRGAGDRLVRQFGIRNTFELPLLPGLSEAGDAGRPIVLADPDGAPASVFGEIAGAVAREVSKLRHGGLVRPEVSYVAGEGIRVAFADDQSTTLSPAAVRRACRCASCVEEMTGQPLLDPASVPEDIYPTSITPMGNYAVAVAWSDGHNSSIYPYEALRELAR